MPDSQAATAPATYTFRVRILGGFSAPPGARRIWRELELTADQTLAELGDAIPLAFGFDDPHLWSFFLSGKPWDRSTEYALPGDDPLDDPKQAAQDFPIPQAPAGREFLFLFDYGDEWHFGVKLVGTGQATRPGVRYPRLVATNGQAPPQYPEVDDE
ncbi:MAG TPA: hypothetical protein VGR74_14185 [Actinomycetota bacterium]|nr:hypothetical protein [Actinomycetota bacterium]